MHASNPQDAAPDGEVTAPTTDHARSRLHNLEGGLSLDALRIDTSGRSARDCAEAGHRWSFKAQADPARVGRLVCVICDEVAPNPAADLEPAVNLDQAGDDTATPIAPALVPSVVRLAGL